MDPAAKRTLVIWVALLVGATVLNVIVAVVLGAGGSAAGPAVIGATAGIAAMGGAGLVARAALLRRSGDFEGNWFVAHVVAAAIMEGGAMLGAVLAFVMKSSIPFAASGFLLALMLVLTPTAGRFESARADRG